MRYFISIQYEEPFPDKYENVTCSPCFSDEKFTFDSGDFVKDWFEMIRYIVMNCEEGGTFSASCSSSVDHFIMDGAPFDSTHLIFPDNDGEDAYLDYKDSTGIEFFVKEGTKPTWQELKDICGHKKIKK